MKKDLLQAVSKIASFLEVDLSPDIVKKIADLTTFKNMKTDRTANMSWRKMLMIKKASHHFYVKEKLETGEIISQLSSLLQWITSARRSLKTLALNLSMNSE